MWKKGIKYLTIVIICEILTIPIIMLVKHYEVPAYAMSYRAHDSALTVDKFLIKIKKIRVSYGYTENQTIIWEGASQEVDIASVNSLSAALNIPGNVKAGKYTVMTVYLDGLPKVKGSVLVGTTTYYTKTAHTNYNVGPAELEEIQPAGLASDAAHSEIFVHTVFPYEFNGTNANGGIYMLVDLRNALSFYDGNGTNPFEAGASAQKMYVNKWNTIITLGSPAKKECYELKKVGGVNKSSLTLLFDSADKLISGASNNLYINSTGIDNGNANEFMIVGGLGDQFNPHYADGKTGTSIAPDAWALNADGTYTVKLKVGALGSFMTEIILDKFRRGSHSGATYTVNMYSSGSLSNLTSTSSGTYDCTLIP